MHIFYQLHVVLGIILMYLADKMYGARLAKWPFQGTGDYYYHFENHTRRDVNHAYYKVRNYLSQDWIQSGIYDRI